MALALAGALLLGTWSAVGPRPATHSGVAASAAQGAGLAAVLRLPVGAQSLISSTVAAGDERFAPHRLARGFGLFGGGVRLALGRGGVDVSGGGGRLSMRPAALGRGAPLRSPGAVSPRVQGGRVVYARAGGVREWYAAGPFGVEQGFTLTRRPAGSSGPVTLALGLGGGLRARQSGAGVVFVTRSGRVALHYGGLVARDASGRRLRAWLSLSGSQLLLRVSDRDARYPLQIDPFVQQGPKLTANDESGDGELGYSVALSEDGDTALIGGPSDNEGVGAAWVFVRSESGAWTQQGSKLTANDESGIGRFGYSVALSGDGDTALIGGAFNNEAVGAAWVFVRSESGAWTQQGSELTANDESGTGFFGYSVALSSDGNTALIGGLGNEGAVGAAWVFVRSESGAWTQQGTKLTANDESGTGEFGSSVALSSDGTTALIGGPRNEEAVGAAWVFVRSESGAWTQQGTKLTANDESGAGEFGFSVALSSDGNTALIGGRFDHEVGAAWVFVRSESGAWTQQGPKLTPNDEGESGEFGYSVALSGEGNTALISDPDEFGFTGAAWVFLRSESGAWTQQSPELTPNDESGEGKFGSSVALSGDGNTMLIGGPEDSRTVGAAWVFFDQLPPAITSPASATFTVGQPGSFTATATGRPTPSLSESGALPPGVSFSEDPEGTATLSGTPAAGSEGVYHLTITAANPVAPGAAPSSTTQSFTLTVEAPPPIKEPPPTIKEPPPTVREVPPPPPVVPAPPNELIGAPVSGALYTSGQRVASSFTCVEGAGGPGIASCLEQLGDPSGSLLETVVPGVHTFTVTARSKDGLSTSRTTTYRVLAVTQIHVTRLHPTSLGHGCVVREATAEGALRAQDAASCNQLRLSLSGVIEAGGKLAASATGTIQVSFAVTLRHRHRSGSARGSVGDGRWQVTLLLPAIDPNPPLPSYLITAHYSGDQDDEPATTSRHIRLESERSRPHVSLRRRAPQGTGLTARLSTSALATEADGS
jgi:hypothetical protein